MLFIQNNPLSHLSSAKLGATEQRWAAQLAAFDFQIRYRSGKVNKNADALSRQHLPAGQDLSAMIPGTSLPQPVQKALQAKIATARQGVVVALPQLTLSDICSLQQADPVIGEVLSFWKWGQRSNHDERKRFSWPVLTLVQQWDRLTDKDVVVYRKINRPDGVDVVL